MYEEQHAVGNGKLFPRCRHSCEIDQITLSDVRLVPPPGELDEIYERRFKLDFDSVHYVKVTSSTKPKMHGVSPLPSEKDRATTTGNMYRKLGKYGRVVFEICKQTDRRQTNKQTHRPTHRHADCNTSHPYCE